MPDSGLCQFNGVAFRIGEYVLSGSELLRCEATGLWVRKGGTAHGSSPTLLSWTAAPPRPCDL